MLSNLDDIREFVRLVDKGASATAFRKSLGLSLSDVKINLEKLQEYRRLLSGEVLQTTDNLEKKITCQFPVHFEFLQTNDEIKVFVKLHDNKAQFSAFNKIFSFTTHEYNFHTHHLDYYRSIVGTNLSPSFDFQKQITSKSYHRHPRIVEECNCKEPKLVELPVRVNSASVNTQVQPTISKPIQVLKPDHNKRVLVVMPCFNSALTVNEALKCFTNQTYSNFRLVVCDDGSSDDTWDVLSQLQKTIDFVLLRNIQNLGIGRTINKCINFMTCRGCATNTESKNFDYITWVGSDNTYYTNFIEEHVKKLCEGNAITFSSWHSNYNMGNLQHSPNTSYKHLKYGCAFGPSFMFTRRLWYMAGPFHEYPGEDYLFYVKCAILGAKFGIISTPLMSYIFRGDSTTAKIASNEIKDIVSPEASFMAQQIEWDNGEERYG